MMSSKIRNFAIVLVALIWSNAAVAQSGKEGPGVSPPPGDLPVPVTVGVYLIDITNIDETRNTFDVEMDVAVTWTDSRLVFDPAAAGSDRRICVGPESETYHKSIWSARSASPTPWGS